MSLGNPLLSLATSFYGFVKVSWLKKTMVLGKTKEKMCRVDDVAQRNLVWLLKPVGIVSVAILVVSVFAIVGGQLYTDWQSEQNCQDRMRDVKNKLQDAQNEKYRLTLDLQAAQKENKDLQSRLQEARSEKSRLSGNLDEARDQGEELKRALIVSDVYHLNSLLKLALFTITVLATIMLCMVWFGCRRRREVYVSQPGLRSKSFLMIAAGSDD